MLNFGIPLGSYVVEARRRDDRKAYEEDVCLGVRERSQSIVVFLTGGIPQNEENGLEIHHETDGVVIKDCGDIFSRESVCGIGYQQTCLSNGAIARHHTFYGLSCLRHVSGG